MCYVAVKRQQLLLKEAVDVLIQRVSMMISLMEKMKTGEIAYDHSLVRTMGSFADRLPAADGSTLVSSEYHSTHKDSILNSLLATMMSAVASGAYYIWRQLTST